LTSTDVSTFRVPDSLMLRSYSRPDSSALKTSKGARAEYASPACARGFHGLPSSETPATFGKILSRVSFILTRARGVNAPRVAL